MSSNCCMLGGDWLTIVKSAIINFIQTHIDENLTDEELMRSTKDQLLEMVKHSRFQVSYAVDKLLQDYDIKCLRLPPYHCEYNPIELAWSGFKRKFRRINFQDEDIEKVREQVINSLFEEDSNWQGYVEHCHKLEEETFANVVREQMDELSLSLENILIAD